jgi:hypothetical protein
LGKDAQNADKLEQLGWKLNELWKELEDPHHLQQKYNDLQKHYQSLILQMMEPKGLVSWAMNLPFDELEEFDESDAVSTETFIRKQTKVLQFLTMLMQRNCFDGLVELKL